MVNRWLQDITKIDGVEGVFLASVRGKILNKVGIKQSEETLEKLTVHLLRTIAAFHMQAKNVTELEFYWDNQYVICKNSNNFILVTICRSPEVLALLRITLNVALANLLEDKKFAKNIRGHASDKELVLKKGFFDETEKMLISKLK